MPKFPDHSTTALELSDRVFSELLAEARKSPKKIYPLHVGDTYLEPIVEARAESQRGTLLHNYASTHGEGPLLRAIVHKHKKNHGVTLQPEHVQVMPGATSGLSVVVQTLLQPGDEVVLLAPFWPLIRGIVKSRGARVIEVPSFDRMNQADFDLERALEHAITERTVAMYVNSPHNPTGHILSNDEVARIGKVAQRHGLWILSDEAYEDLWYTPTAPVPAWTHASWQERAIVTHTISKSYGMAGARIGYTHGPENIMRAIRGVQTFQVYCAARPMQHAAAQALALGDAWLAHARSAYGYAAQTAANVLGVPVPQSGTFLFFDTKPYRKPAETDAGFLERCLKEGVLLTPGSACGKDYASWARLCFTAVPPEELHQALQALQSVLR